MRAQKAFGSFGELVDAFVAHFTGHQSKVLRIVIEAIFLSGSARLSHLALQIVAMVTKKTGKTIQHKSARNRVWRLLRNLRLDDIDLASALLKLVAHVLGVMGTGTPLLLPVDWTEWHSGMKLLVCSAVVGNRSIPVFAAAFFRKLIHRSQNTWENTFMQLMAMVVHSLGLPAVFLFDRGFRRVEFIRLLLNLQVDFVVRLKTDVHVRAAGFARTVSLGSIPIKPGQIIDLGTVALRQTKPVWVRVIGVWAPGMKYPWWLATSLKARPQVVAQYYYKRMAIEEQFRDVKGSRFGLALEWTRFAKPEYLARMCILVGVAALGWMVFGTAATLAHPALAMPHPTKGPRYSAITLGRLLAAMAIELSHQVPERTLRAQLRPQLPSMDWVDQVVTPRGDAILKLLERAYKAMLRQRPKKNQSNPRGKK